MNALSGSRLPEWVLDLAGRAVGPVLAALVLAAAAWMSGIPAIAHDIAYIRGSISKLENLVDAARIDVVRHDQQIQALRYRIDDCLVSVRDLERRAHP